ncbi:hypothetical protein GCM10010924_52570 [Rhizobium wenxiniae]|nr:hypothetical protein GCM10010924_52570 [Rhizobium wenxiniae]
MLTSQRSRYEGTVDGNKQIGTGPITFVPPAPFTSSRDKYNGPPMPWSECDPLALDKVLAGPRLTM